MAYSDRLNTCAYEAHDAVYAQYIGLGDTECDVSRLVVGGLAFVVILAVDEYSYEQAVVDGVYGVDVAIEYVCVL